MTICVRGGEEEEVARCDERDILLAERGDGRSLLQSIRKRPR